MKRLLLAISLALAMLALLAVVVYAQTSGSLWVPLYAGQNEEVGFVQVWNDTDNVYVHYVLSDSWKMVDSHVQIEIWRGVQTTTLLLNEEGVTNKKGTPMPGQFDYQFDHDPNVSEYIYSIALSDIYTTTEGDDPCATYGATDPLCLCPTWDPDKPECYNDLFIAAHASLGNEQTLYMDQNSDGVSIEASPLSDVFTGTFNILQEGTLTGGGLVITCTKDSSLLGYTASISGTNTSFAFGGGGSVAPAYTLAAIDLFYGVNTVIITPTLSGGACEMAVAIDFYASEETAWAGQEAFDTKRWSSYLIYEMQKAVGEPWPPDSGTVSVAYEDRSSGVPPDYDYNDWVADIQTDLTFLGDSDELLSARFTILPEARGAGYIHDFYIRLPASVFGSPGTIALTTISSDGTETKETLAVGYDPELGAEVKLNGDTGQILPDLINTTWGDLPNTVEPENTCLFRNYNPSSGEYYRTGEYITPEMTFVLEVVFESPAPFIWSNYYPYQPYDPHGYTGLIFDPLLYVYNYENQTEYWIPEPGSSAESPDVRRLIVPEDWLWPESLQQVWLAYDGVQTLDDGTTVPWIKACQDDPDCTQWDVPQCVAYHPQNPLQCIEWQVPTFGAPVVDEGGMVTDAWWQHPDLGGRNSTVQYDYQDKTWYCDSYVYQGKLLHEGVIECPSQ